MTGTNAASQWDEIISQRYLDYGRYFVPEREAQMRMIAELVGTIDQPGCVLELCCGEGLLAEILLERLSGWACIGMDGSDLMLERAGKRLALFGERLTLRKFDLAGQVWPTIDLPIQAVVSMLAIHHLDAQGKQWLFSNIYSILASGGLFVVADMVEPVSTAGRRLAADEWDDVVRKRSQELDGSQAGYKFFEQEKWNTYRYPDPDDIDHPSPLFLQLKWLEEAGFSQIEVHFMQAGHALFSGWKLEVR